MRGAVRWLACFALIACAPARTQTFDATKIGTPANLSTATWHFTLGDDLRWADPAFDDSQWKTFTPEKNFKAQGMSVPSGMWWYRLHVQVRPGSRTLAITMVESNYQVFINGKLVGQQGSFPGGIRSANASWEQVYPIPADAIHGDTIVIAVRQWLDPFLGQYDFGLSGPMLLGGRGWLNMHSTLRRNSSFFDSFGDVAQGLIGFMVGIWALALFRAQPEHREYLWLAFMGLVDATGGCLSPALRVTQLPAWEVFLPGAILNVLDIIALVLFVCAFLRVRINWWIRVYCLALLWTPLINMALWQGWILQKYYLLGVVIVSTPVDLFAPLLAIRQYRRGDREAGMLLLPLLLLATADYGSLLDSFLHLKEGRLHGNVIPRLHLGPVEIWPQTISFILFYLAIGGIMLHRSFKITREQQRTAAELEEGRSVQAFLLGRDASAPGFTVESAYLPAQEVGGDFFQTIAGADGSLLAVIGDVAGKGLQAAMRVSMLIGAVRLSPDETPAALLRKLNCVLLQDGSSGLTTCLAARLDANGTVTIANAGHLSPYINGRELAIDGGLPLGVAAGTDYTEQTFPFAASDLMLLMSDGVVEARSPAGELFGFKRMADIAADVTTAAALAETARAFGQDDDITVLLLKRATAV